MWNGLKKGFNQFVDFRNKAGSLFENKDRETEYFAFETDFKFSEGTGGFAEFSVVKETTTKENIDLVGYLGTAEGKAVINIASLNELNIQVGAEASTVKSEVSRTFNVNGYEIKIGGDASVLNVGAGIEAVKTERGFKFGGHFRPGTVGGGLIIEISKEKKDEKKNEDREKDKDNEKE